MQGLIAHGGEVFASSQKANGITALITIPPCDRARDPRQIHAERVQRSWGAGRQSPYKGYCLRAAKTITAQQLSADMQDAHKRESPTR